MRLNGRFDDAVEHCLVSPAVASHFPEGPILTHAIVQAPYSGTGFTAEVPVDVEEIDCDLVAGRQWMSLFCLVTDNCPFAEHDCRDDVVPSNAEESLTNNSPHLGCVSVDSGADHGVPSGAVLKEASRQEESVRLDRVPFRLRHSPSVLCITWHPGY
ncbi:hypothetical protein J3R83DRAFT_2287 [Lanmaoa asiatica]|nr:hypothetical protein J3R83DRAFT_2287 [Lanmaoa asiatica]